MQSLVHEADKPPLIRVIFLHLLLFQIHESSLRTIIIAEHGRSLSKVLLVVCAHRVLCQSLMPIGGSRHHKSMEPTTAMTRVHEGSRVAHAQASPITSCFRALFSFAPAPLRRIFDGGVRGGEGDGRFMAAYDGYGGVLFRGQFHGPHTRFYGFWEGSLRSLGPRAC